MFQPNLLKDEKKFKRLWRVVEKITRNTNGIWNGIIGSVRQRRLCGTNWR